MTFVGVDWGTTSLRAYLLDEGGRILAQRQGSDGIKNCRGEYHETLLRYIQPWLGTDVRHVVLSGMITSRHGWVETPYLLAPASGKAMAESLVHRHTADGLDLWFAPGLRLEHDHNTIDVMRGEETQVLGCLTAGAPDVQLVILPGSHSKWILVESGEISWFSTFLTGELFAAVAKHTIVGATLLPEAPSEVALLEGVQLGLSDDQALGGLLHKLFSLRVLGLFDPRGGVPRDLLTGLVLGTEIREALAQVNVPLPVATVIGHPALAEQYVTALRAAGLQAVTGPDDAAAVGLHQLVKAKGLT